MDVMRVLQKKIDTVSTTKRGFLNNYKLTEFDSFVNQVEVALDKLLKSSNADIAEMLMLTRGDGTVGDNSLDTTVTLEEIGLDDVTQVLQSASFEVELAGSHRKGLQVGRVRDFDVLIFPSAEYLNGKPVDRKLGYLIRQAIANTLLAQPGRLFSDEVKAHNETILNLKKKDKIMDLLLPAKSSVVLVDFVPAIRVGDNVQIFSPLFKKWANIEEIPALSEVQKLLIVSGKFLKRFYESDIDSYKIERFVLTDPDLVALSDTDIDSKFKIIFTKLFNLVLEGDDTRCYLAQLLLDVSLDGNDHSFRECVRWTERLYESTHEKTHKLMGKLKPTELPGDVSVTFAMALASCR